MGKHATIHDIPFPKSAFKAADYASDNKLHLIVAATGSVASIKIPLILSALSAYSSNLSIRCVFTNASLLFLPPLDLLLKNNSHIEDIHLTHHEWPAATVASSIMSAGEGEEGDDSIIWSAVGDPILHIELRRWADMLLIAPLSANALAKISNGNADDLLTSVVRAWDTTPTANKKIMVAPAMNTMMWEHPITRKQIGVLKDEWTWFRVLMPVEKVLACGDSGSGGMMEWSNIVKTVVEELRPKINSN